MIPDRSRVVPQDQAGLGMREGEPQKTPKIVALSTGGLQVPRAEMGVGGALRGMATAASWLVEPRTVPREPCWGLRPSRICAWTRDPGSACGGSCPPAPRLGKAMRPSL